VCAFEHFEIVFAGQLPLLPPSIRPMYWARIGRISPLRFLTEFHTWRLNRAALVYSFYRVVSSCTFFFPVLNL